HQDGALLGDHPREAGGEGDHREGGMGDGTLSALKRYNGVYLISPPGCAVTQ
ncbi:hypothetical protein KEJ49_04485, partial [Candidatus Bathyarchaeota archaeon]|nr:hypothetical protein [Candidatus Bathyarchaeota archaeon]